MKKQAIFRAAVLAALTLSAVILGWLCFGASSPAIVEINPLPVAQTSIFGTPAPDTAPTQSEAAPAVPAEQEEQTGSPAVTNRLGTLTIGNTQIFIAANVDESTLEKSPGWMPDSALPGESGMCVILGHRNRKHLRPLEKVELGDIITFSYPDGKIATYTVTETMIYENTADWRLPSAVGDSLVIVTCYPFRYSGNAPGKYAVFCRLVVV